MDTPPPIRDTAEPDVGFAVGADDPATPDVVFSLGLGTPADPTAAGSENPARAGDPEPDEGGVGDSADVTGPTAGTGSASRTRSGRKAGSTGRKGSAGKAVTAGSEDGIDSAADNLDGDTGDAVVPGDAGGSHAEIGPGAPATVREASDVELSENGLQALGPGSVGVGRSAPESESVGGVPFPASTDAAPDDPDEDKARELAFDLARELAAAAPREWTRLDAVFALTTTEGVARVFYTGPEQIVEAVPTEPIMTLARAQRDSTAVLDDGPWWRLILGLTVEGEIEVDYDYGEEPFPEEQLLSPEAYRTDLDTYPRGRLPVWLAAYIDDDGSQERDAEQAAFQESLDRAAGIRPDASIDDLPPLAVMWSRWVALAAVFVASGSALGPRIMPSLAWFEGATHSGSTLALLPGGRAVLSGGLWEAPALDAAYNDGADLPELYRGAPFWVADQVLNPRATQGMLSFCYWWDGTGWYRGESPSPVVFARAMPGVWTTEVVTDLIVRQLADDDPTDDLRAAAAAVVDAAQERSVRRELIADLLGADPEFDADGAHYQFFLGGLTEPDSAELSR